MRMQRQAHEILKAYGQRMYAAHVAYMNGDSRITSVKSRARARRTRVRKAAVLIAAIVLITGLTAVVCNALGINLFGFRFSFRDGFAVLTNQEDSGKKFYEPNYIVSGFQPDDVLRDENRSIDYLYVDKKSGRHYTVSESTTKDLTLHIDTEDGDLEKVNYGIYEVYVHEYKKTGRCTVYLKKNKTTIIINGDISRKDAFAVIGSFRD